MILAITLPIKFSWRLKISTVDSIWEGGSTPLVAKLFPDGNWLNRFIWFFESVHETFFAIFNANHMTLASSGASHVTYSQQGVMRECEKVLVIIWQVFNIFPWIFLLYENIINFLPQTSKVFVEVLWLAWKRAAKFRFRPIWGVLGSFPCSQ